MVHYSCIGATGYVCGEVLRMMVNHPEGELVNVLDTYGVGDAISTHGYPAYGPCAARLQRGIRNRQFLNHSSFPIHENTKGNSRT